MNFRNVVVPKPWGFEFLAFESEDVALWTLHIRQGERTSMHAHPKKSTGYVLLRGTVKLNFLADSKVISAPDKQMLRRGLFHQTEALTDDVLLLEVENPNDKGDLVRLHDSYGRSSSGYEVEKVPSGSTHPWIDLEAGVQEVDFGVPERKIETREILSLQDFGSLANSDIVMFLSGGIGKLVDGRRHLATVPGDVGKFEILKRVVEGMEFSLPRTWILRIT